MARELTRDSGMNALWLPVDPAPMLSALAQTVDAAYRELAARLGDDTPAGGDEDGKLHVAAPTAVPDPPSLTDLRRRVVAMIPRLGLPELRSGSDVVASGIR